MYKAIYYIVLILLVSCTSESRDILDSFENQGCGIPVQFTYSIEDLKETNTRGIITGTKLPDNDEDLSIGVYALKEKCIDEENFIFELIKNKDNEWSHENFQTYFDNAEYISKSDSKIFTSLKKNEQGCYPNDTEITNPSLRIYAYYPYNVAIKYSDGTQPYLTVTRTEEPFYKDDQTDYLYTGTIHSLARNGYANLKFHHAQARFRIRFFNRKECDVQVSEICIKTTNNQSGKLRIATGEFEPNTGGSVLRELPPSNSRLIRSEEDKLIGDFLLFPCEDGTETIESISLTIDSEEKIIYEKDNTALEKRFNLSQGKTILFKVYLNN